MGKKTDTELDLMVKYKELLDKHQQLMVENEMLRQQLDQSNVEELKKIIHEKEASILAATSALIIYADKEMYRNYDEDFKFSTIELDEGKIAREALNTIKENA